MRVILMEKFLGKYDARSRKRCENFLLEKNCNSANFEEEDKECKVEKRYSSVV